MTYVPRNLHVPSALLEELIGTDQVIELLRSGQIERGVKDYHRRPEQRPASAAEVKQANDEFQRQMALLDKEIREATHGSQNVS